MNFLQLWEAHPWAISLIVVAAALALREILRNVLGIPD